MPALPSYAMETVKDNINKFRDNELRTIQNNITDDDMVLYYVPSHLRELCYEVRKYYGNAGASSWRTVKVPLPAYGGKDCWASLYYNSSSDAPVLPKEDLVSPPKEGPLLHKVIEDIEAQIIIRSRWALVKSLCEWLDDNLKTPAEVRFVFPAILNLLQGERTKGLVSRIAEAKPPKHMTAIPVPVRQACKEASTIMATAMLMPEIKYSTPTVAVSTSTSPIEVTTDYGFTYSVS